MSLTNFTGNTSVISGLPDEPSLSATQLKGKFDEAGTNIKEFINVTLEPEIEQLVATEKSALQGMITALGNQLRNALIEDNQRRYHVGRIIFDTENVNPATYLGFGVWQLWGKGRVPVGVDIEDIDFNQVEKTGGEKKHTLTINEMPSHNHQRKQTGRSLYWDENLTEIGGLTTGNNVQVSWERDTTNTGGGQSHNNMQPYITCYMWKRVS